MFKLLAKREGLNVTHVFEESRTAKAPGRPQFNLMLSEIEKGKAQGILAWHPDRLARNSVDGGRIVYLVDTGKIKDLRFPTFRFEASAHGKFMLNIAFSQSKYYVDNLSENIKRGIRQKLRNGIWPNRPPVGYFNDRNNRCIAVQPEKAKLVRKAFELYATGNYALHEVRSRMEEVGLTSCQTGECPFRISNGCSKIFSTASCPSMASFMRGSTSRSFPSVCLTRCRRSWRRKANPRRRS